MFNKVTLSVLLVGFCIAPAQAQPPGGMPPPPPVEVMTVQAQDVAMPYKYVGTTQPSKIVEVRARIEGFLESREFQEGALVDEGTVLFTIDARPMQADLQIATAQVAQAETRRKLADQEVKRLQSVTVPGAIAAADVDRQIAERENASAALRLTKAQQAKAQLEVSYATVKAPLSGYVGKALKEIGSLVDTGQNSLLTVMQQVDPIYVSFQMSERDYLEWRRARSNNEVVQAGANSPYLEVSLLDGSTYEERGEITFEEVAVDRNTGTVELRGTFPNPKHSLKPGQFVDVHLKGWTRPGAIAVPQRAVSQSPQGSYVYVVNEQDIAELRSVKPGPWSGDNWVIEEGLKAGERIVVEGLVKVQPGGKVTPVAPAQASPAAPAGAAQPGKAKPAAAPAAKKAA